VQIEGVLPKSNRSADSLVSALRTPLKTFKTPAKWITRTQRSALQAFGQHARDTTAKERRLQPAETAIPRCCRVNAAFLSDAFGRDGGDAKLRASKLKEAFRL
jgi:hypothetical protein